MIFRVYHFLALFLTVTTGSASYMFYYNYGEVNALVISLFFFLSMNSLICIWEISLGLNIGAVKLEYDLLNEKYKSKKFSAVIALFMEHLTVNKLFSLLFWSRIWSVYSLFDPSYSNRESFGFFVDVGNGWTTIIPSAIFIANIISPSIDARYLGMLGLIKFYQEFYGTCIYFLSYIMNKRYVGTSLTSCFLFVGFANGLWFVFPLIGMWACSEMILSGTYNVFH